MSGKRLKQKVELKRFADLAAEGWYAADFHNHCSVEQMELLMRAEDIHMGFVIGWWNARRQWRAKAPPAEPIIKFGRDRYCYFMVGEDERGAGDVLYFNMPRPIIPEQTTWLYPPTTQLVEEASRHPEAWIDAERPYWWALPVWLACGRIDSIGVLSNGVIHDNEGWGRVRDRARYPAPWGDAIWSQDIYFHLLNCGLRIPPSAGTASGNVWTPFAYNRVYVHVRGDLTYEKWWNSLRQGRCFITNGPLLRCRANGKLPGHVFTVPKGDTLNIEVKAQLDTRDPVPFLEIIKNGQVERNMPFKAWQEAGSLGTLSFQESGWFLVRAVADVPETYRFAMTGPYYVEIGDKRTRVSKKSVRFFLDWVREGIERIRSGEYLIVRGTPSPPYKVKKVPTEREQEHILQYHARAEKFWRDRLNEAYTE